MPRGRWIRRSYSRTESSGWGSIHPRPDTRRANSSTCSVARAMRASFSRPMPARKGRRATSGKHSTCSASPASITAIAHWRMRHWWGGPPRDEVPLTMCPLSNLRLRVVDDLRHHPLRRMMDRGVIVTVNSDDPAYFGGYINQNYLAVSEALGLERQEIAAIVRNGIKVSLMTAPEKDKVLADLDRVLAESA